jgi:hypothetical protein
MGPTLQVFWVQDFTISNAKQQHTKTPKLQKCERKMGPTLRGFTIRDSTISNAKQQHTTTLELRKM